MNLMEADNNGLRCEAFVIWGRLHKLPLQSHLDQATNLRWPVMHDDVTRLQFITATTGMGGATRNHVISVHIPSVACDYD